MTKKTYNPHYSTSTDPRAVQTREALRLAFLKLLDYKPFEQISIRDIAAESGVGYTTFCRHFSGKEALLGHIADEEIRKLIEKALPAFYTADLHLAARILCQEVAEHRELWTTLLTGGAASEVKEGFIRSALGIADSWQTPVDWIPPEMGVTLAASTTIELLSCWLKQAEPISVEQIATIFEHLVIVPITTQPKAS